MTDWNAKRHDRLMELPVGVLVGMYERLEANLVRPPFGWYSFGTHAGDPVEVEFWGQGEDGMPIWERPMPYRVKASPCNCPCHTNPNYFHVAACCTWFGVQNVGGNVQMNTK